MGGYYLCQIPRACHPYYMESIDVNIWSIEELCYYMRENVYLIDETVLSEKLCDWLEAELHLKKLAGHLRGMLEKGAHADEFVMPIFRECGYLTATELVYFKEKLVQVQMEPIDVRRKMKADYLVHYGMYICAIHEYERILKQRGPGRLGIQFYAVVLENMAAAYARLFRFEEAAGCLWESYQVLKSRRVYEKYLRLLPLFLPEKQYLARLEEIRADRDLAAAMKADAAAILQEGQTSALAGEWDTLEISEQIEKLKEEYRRNT